MKLTHINGLRLNLENHLIHQTSIVLKTLCDKIDELKLSQLKIYHRTEFDEEMLELIENLVKRCSALTDFGFQERSLQNNERNLFLSFRSKLRTLDLFIKRAFSVHFENEITLEEISLKIIGNS